jgi:predicted RecB family nuclease
MKITSDLFEAYLQCPMKCWLRATGEPGTAHPYSAWVKSRKEYFRASEIDRLLAEAPDGEVARAPTPENLKAGKWRLAVDVTMAADNVPRLSRGREGHASYTRPLGDDPRSLPHGFPIEIGSLLHALERAPSRGGRGAEFIPIRCVFFNKVSRDNRLLLAFDALVLSAALRRAITVGKIIHGDEHAALRVRTEGLAGDVRKQLGKIVTLLSRQEPPDLVLHRHCAECEFQPGCRQQAMEKDDLSLLAGMSGKEREKLRSTGIFTVTQLAYTFRPRRRPKRFRNKREKYHHALKALAIREQKIHIVGRPALATDGTPVYLDVEGVPDRDFYYLIGMRVGTGESAVQHSLWADTVEDEEKIWWEFLGILDRLENPVLVHYGKYETTFLRQMRARYGVPPEGSAAAAPLEGAVNLLATIFAQVYYPCHSNGLKDIAHYLGFRWSDSAATGTWAIAQRDDWESSRTADAKQALLTYNAEDCQALEVVANNLGALGRGLPQTSAALSGDVVDIALVKREHPYGFKQNIFAFPELETINTAAYWDYQRERIFVKSNPRLKRPVSRATRARRLVSPDTTLEWGSARACPRCNSTDIRGHARKSRIVLDLRFMPRGVKRDVTRYCFHRYICQACGRTFAPEDRPWTRSPFGSGLIAYALYLMIELRLPQMQVDQMLRKFLGLRLPIGGVAHCIKERAAQRYRESYEGLLARLCRGRLLHADETKVKVREGDGFVWVLANMEEVAYVYSETREGDLLRNLLTDFRGVLVSDFYAAYEAIPCPQQKCLIHLIRDLNDDVLKHPYDQELKQLAVAFTRLLKPMVETIDRYGLKTRFLRKHRTAVARFYRETAATPWHSETAVKLKERFEKNRDTLFTFLNFDGVPWNNNNAEHAVKSFAALRRIFEGITSERGIQDYLVLLSLSETCKYMGLDFLDFLRSGEKDIHVFAENQRVRR